MALTSYAKRHPSEPRPSRPALTAERERHLLLTRRRSCDERVRQQALSELWESHSSLVVVVARQYRRPDLDMADLVGAGHLGMQAAIEGFDPDRFDTRLSIYAVNWIRYYIQDYIRRHAHPVRPPSVARRQLFRTAGTLFADARRACHREGIEATDSELCTRVGGRIGLSGEEVAQALQLARGNAPSLDAPADAQAVILRLDDAKLRGRVMVLVGEVLGERERTVFLARCMADEDGPRQHASLAAELGVTRERVYQLEVSARRKIVAALACDGQLDPTATSLELPKLRASRRVTRRRTEARASMDFAPAAQ